MTSLDAFFDFLKETASQATDRLDMGNYTVDHLMTLTADNLEGLRGHKATRLQYLANAIAAEISEMAIEVAMYRNLEAAIAWQAAAEPLEVAA